MSIGHGKTVRESRSWKSKEVKTRRRRKQKTEEEEE